MIRIGITSFGTDNGKSGIGSYLRELLIRFDSDTYTKEFSFELIGPKEDRDHYLEGKSNISWYPVESADRNPVQNFFWNQISLPAICKKQKYDLLFLPAANRRLTGRAPCPTIGTVHDLASLHIKNKYNFSHKIFNEKMLPKLIHGLDQIITVSQFSKDDIVYFAHVPEEKVSVIHLAADKNTFFPVKGQEGISCTNSKEV